MQLVQNTIEKHPQPIKIGLCSGKKIIKQNNFLHHANLKAS